MKNCKNCSTVFLKSMKLSMFIHFIHQIIQMTFLNARCTFSHAFPIKLAKNDKHWLYTQKRLHNVYSALQPKIT